MDLILINNTHSRLYQPLRYCSKTVLECGLTPFIRKMGEKCLNLIAVPILDSDLSDESTDYMPKLDAYQALMIGMIDSNSYLFSRNEYFRHIVGDDLTEKILSKLAKSK